MERKDRIIEWIDVPVPVALIILAELLIFAGNLKAAIAIHAINLMMLVIFSIYISSSIVPVLMLLPLFRLLNLATPIFFNQTIYFFPLVYFPMLVPLVYMLREGMVTRSQAGITTRGFLFYLPLALAVGFALGLIEHRILRAEALVPDLSLKSILILSATMIFLVGLVEEFMFRSALQTMLEKRLGSVPGLLVASLIFGLMHSGYHIPLEIVFVSLAGLVFGLLFWITRSLPVISLAHGVTNISLFLVVPVYPNAVFYIIGASMLLFLLNALAVRKTRAHTIILRLNGR